MIRQARTYFAGAMSATVLIAVAVVAFIVLVSVQALESWPLAGSPSGPGATEQSAATLPVRQVRAARAAARRGAGPGRHVGRRARAHHRGSSDFGVTSGSAGASPAAGTAPQPASADGGQAGGSAPASGTAPAQTGTRSAPVETATGTVGGLLPEAESTVRQTGVTGPAEPVLQEAAPATQTVNGAVGKVTETASGLTTTVGH